MGKFKFEIQAFTEIEVEADSEYEAEQKVFNSDELYYEELLDSAIITKKWYKEKKVQRQNEKRR